MIATTDVIIGINLDPPKNANASGKEICENLLFNKAPTKPAMIPPNTDV